jgi:hypothetical protein
MKDVTNRVVDLDRLPPGAMDAFRSVHQKRDDAVAKHARMKARYPYLLAGGGLFLAVIFVAGCWACFLLHHDHPAVAVPFCVAFLFAGVISMIKLTGVLTRGIQRQGEIVEAAQIAYKDQLFSMSSDPTRPGEAIRKPF